MIKFEQEINTLFDMETNTLLRYHEEFFKSGLC